MTDYRKDFINAYKSICVCHNRWTVWQDFIDMSACAIANALDDRMKVKDKREELYLSIVKKYHPKELDMFAKMLALTAMAFDENPEQDFLGEIFMDLNFGGDHGQFFTPWNVAEMMAELVYGGRVVSDPDKDVDYISVNDCACGSGVMLLAFANCCRKHGLNYQKEVIFVAQDIDPTVAKMCYIQVSLLGCPGYVYVGNTFTEPITGDTLHPIVHDPENLWFTPLYFVNYHYFRFNLKKKRLEPCPMPSKELQKEATETCAENRSKDKSEVLKKIKKFFFYRPEK